MKYSLWIRYYSERTGLAEEMRWSGAILNDLLDVLLLWMGHHPGFDTAWLYAEDGVGNRIYYGMADLTAILIEKEVHNSD